MRTVGTGGRCTACRRRGALAGGGWCDRCWHRVVDGRRESDRIEAARRRDLPEWALDALAADGSPLVRAEVAGRADLPPEIIAALADPVTEPDRTVLRRIARHPRLTEHALDLISTDDLHTLRRVAQNPTCPIEALTVLAGHPDPTLSRWARARIVAARLDGQQRLRLPVGLRRLLS